MLKISARVLREEAWCWFEFILRPWPGRVGMKFRGLLESCFFRSAGTGTKISEGTHIWNPGNLSLGNKVRIGRGVHLNCVSDISIGSNVMIGPYVVFTTTNHKFGVLDKPMNQQGTDSECIILGDNIWVGAFAVILPGVVIGTGAVVAAGAVVTKSVKENSIVGGIPARVLSSRENQNSKSESR